MLKTRMSKSTHCLGALLAFIEALTLTSALAPHDAQADVIHVHAEASGANDGTSWSNAYSELHQALSNCVSGDEVWVAGGVYTPVDAEHSLNLVNGVGMYGGFSGNETSREQRNPSVNLTILSGDILQDDTVDSSPFAPPWPYNVNHNTTNARKVIVANGVNAATVLDGFRIVKGGFGPGGGLYCNGSGLIVRNCYFAENFANFGHGGAIFLWDSNASITDCTFYHNLAYQGSGGAIFIAGASTPTIRDCTFSANMAVATNGQTGQGGAIQIDTTMDVTIERCTFDGNISKPFQTGSFEIPRGGAISSFCVASDPTTTIRECVFRNNQSAYGGAIFVWNPSRVLNCAIDHNTAFTYAGSGGQSVGGEGAGMTAQWTTLTVLNCSVANNVGGESSGIAIFEFLPNFPAEAVVRNSIIWGNVALGQDVSPRNVGIRGNYSAEYSCIQDLFTDEPGEDPIDPANYPGCIAVNPAFVSAATGNLRLLGNSPCIDAGGNSYVLASMVFDLDGHARFINDPVVTDTGNGTAPLVDMGAFEHAPALLLGDVNCDGILNVADAEALVGVLMGTDQVPCHLAGADITNDQSIDGLDVQALVDVLTGA